jgi:signal transduction histidine kinase
VVEVILYKHCVISDINYMTSEWRRTTQKLTIRYSVVFLGFLSLFSIILYFWVNSSLGDSYVEQVSGQVENIDRTESSVQKSNAARVGADVAIQRFRTILLAVDGIAAVLVPFASYALTRRTLRPLIESQEQQKQFIADASHELRTPLAVLSGELELALRKNHSYKNYERVIANAKFEVDHMTRLTTALLLLAQLDEVENKLPKSSIINTLDLLTTIQQQLSSEAEVKTITLTVQCPGDALLVANEAFVMIAISNIIDNAIKYSKNRSEVIINVSAAPQGRTMITVKNYGVGIPTDKQLHLFDRFYRAENSRNSEGFGLGLAISQKIITLHGGKITYTSDSEETIFYVLI